MRVTVVSHDLAHNCLGRAHVLAMLLAGFADVDIVGPSADGSVWSPLRDTGDVPIRRLDEPAAAGAVADLLRRRPDVIVAVKPRPTSLGLAMRARQQAGVPIIADVDDWELAFCYDQPRWWLRQMTDLRDRNNYWNTLRAERLVRRADAVTVSSRWLQGRFGGMLVPHARHRPRGSLRAAAERWRREHGLDGQRIVLFAGSARPHKGLRDVYDAVADRRDDQTVLVVAGDGAMLPAARWLHTVGPVAFAQLPALIAAADLVVLAQRRNRITAAQVPAKVFDAMAVGTPVVTTDVSDLAEIVGDGGLVVPAGDRAALAQAIRVVLDDTAGAAQMARRGRARFGRCYSIDAVRPAFERLVRDVHGGRAAQPVGAELETV
jgi:glycosyltransferase involved in cell wall biosynthesis